MRALVLGHSGGIGSAVAKLLRDQGADVIGLSRAEGLDWRVPERAEQVLQSVDGPFDLIICATGQLAPEGARPEKTLGQIDAQQMQEVFAVNSFGSALLLKHLPKLIAKEAESKIAVITARVGSIADNQLGGWYSYRASKAAANQLIRTGAIELQRRFPKAVMIAYHPGTVATDFTKDYQANKLLATQAAQHLLSVMQGMTPENSGLFFDWKGEEVPW